MDDELVKKFFADKPVQLRLFTGIRRFILSLGPAGMKVTKSQISFANKRQFAWVWLPRPWDTRRPEDAVILSFSLGKKLVHPGIVQTVEPYPGRFMHHVVIEKESDMTDVFRQWLKAAYAFGEGK